MWDRASRCCVAELADEDDTAFFAEVDLLIQQNAARLRTSRFAHTAVHTAVEANFHNAGRRFGFDGDSIFVDGSFNTNVTGVGGRDDVHLDEDHLGWTTKSKRHCHRPMMQMKPKEQLEHTQGMQLDPSTPSIITPVHPTPSWLKMPVATSTSAAAPADDEEEQWEDESQYSPRSTVADGELSTLMFDNQTFSGAMIDRNVCEDQPLIETCRTFPPMTTGVSVRIRCALDLHPRDRGGDRRRRRSMSNGY
jgi:hypothetical protein